MMKKAKSAGLALLPLLLVVALSGSLLPASAETLTLEQVIREVCTKSDSAKMMRESVKKADEMVREKWSNVYPIISASATGARSRGSAFGGGSSSGSSRTIATASAEDGVSNTSSAPDPYLTRQEFYAFMESLTDAFSTPHTTTIYSTGISVSQPIYTFGKVGAAIKVAEMFRESAHDMYTRNMGTLQLTAVDAFFLVFISEKAVEIAERTLERKNELYGFIDRNFQLGSGSRAQVLNTKADAMMQSSLIIDARKLAQSTQRYLRFLTGRPLDEMIQLDTLAFPASVTGLVLPDPDSSIDLALRERKDISYLRLLAESNRGGAKIMRAMYLPSIGAFGSAGWSKMESGASIMSNDGMRNWMIGLGLSWTLFDGFANSAKAAQFDSDAQKLDIAVSSVKKAIDIEIRNAILEIQSADSNLTATQEMHAAAKEGYDLTYDNFKQGSGQLTELQRVDGMLQSAEIGLLNARYRQVKGRAALLVAMGKEIITLPTEDRK